MRLESWLRLGVATAAFGALLIAVPLAPARAADVGCPAGTQTGKPGTPGEAAADNRDWQQRGTSGASQGVATEDPDSKRPGSSTRTSASGDSDAGGQIQAAKPGARPQVAFAAPTCK